MFFPNILLLYSLTTNGRVNQFAIFNVNALYGRIKEQEGKRDNAKAMCVYIGKRGETWRRVMKRREAERRYGGQTDDE